MKASEDWLALWIGLLMFALSLCTLAGTDLLGWSVTTQVWLSPAKALAPVSKAYAALPGVASLALTYLFLLAIMTGGAAALGLDAKRFAAGFSVILWASYLSWLAGNNAYVAATPDKRVGFGIGWSLSLTGEAGFIVALAAGLAIGNFLPGVARWLAEATRPEWYVKIAIVVLGGALGVKATIVEVYLVCWALVYLIARRAFRLTREWAAPLASGISICGVSAAIATAAAIRARPVVAVMVSSLVVLFAVVWVSDAFFAAG